MGRKPFSPTPRYRRRVAALDVAAVANEHGEPVTLFFGKRRPDGLIVGERFTRTIKRQPGGLEVKSSHWDNHGKTGR